MLHFEQFFQNVFIQLNWFITYIFNVVYLIREICWSVRITLNEVWLSHQQTGHCSIAHTHLVENENKICICLCRTSTLKLSLFWTNYVAQNTDMNIRKRNKCSTNIMKMLRFLLKWWCLTFFVSLYYCHTHICQDLVR